MNPAKKVTDTEETQETKLPEAIEVKLEKGELENLDKDELTIIKYVSVLQHKWEMMNNEPTGDA